MSIEKVLSKEIIDKEQMLLQWINAPAFFDSGYGNIEGHVQYGIRKPLTPASASIHQQDPRERSREVVIDSPSYWFVSNDNQVKVRILQSMMYIVTDQTIRGETTEETITFSYNITRKTEN